MEDLSRDLSVDPEFQRIPLIRCKLIFAKKYADWLKRKSMSNLVIHQTCVPDCLFCIIVHLTIKLCRS